MLRTFHLRPTLLRGPFIYRLASCRHVATAPPLIRIENGTFYRQYPSEHDSVKGDNPPLFQDFSFILPSKEPDAAQKKKKNEKQHWAVIGSPGRTELLNILRGHYICLPPNARSYPYLLTDEINAKNHRFRSASNAIQYIGFSGEGSEAIGGTRGAYLSARYESLREETDWTVGQFLKGQTSLNPLESQKDGAPCDTGFFEQVISDLHLRNLVDMPVANLSNGQTRRARIAKALLNKPELLLLDEPFMGLDPAAVRGISGLLYSLAEKSSPRLILGLRPQDKVPDWITNLIVLGNSGQIFLRGEKSEVGKALKVYSLHYRAGRGRPVLSKNELAILEQGKKEKDAGNLNKQLLSDMGVLPKETSVGVAHSIPDGEPVIEMEGVRVQYGDKVVLGDWKQEVNQELKEGLHWQVRRGQRWVIVGPNGSGKTTLLSLITSDHPQAYALPVRIFGRSRLPEPGKPAISIFELQSRLGHSSPEIHAFFPRQLTIRQSLESAFAETFLSKPRLNHDRDLDVSAILRFAQRELDPNASETLDRAPPNIGLEKGVRLPKIENANKGRYIQTEFGLDYADNITFGSLSTAQQRMLLFFRALVHRPDIVILDEAFSGMPASMRDKCFEFLEIGETNASYLKPSYKQIGRMKETTAKTQTQTPPADPEQPDPDQLDSEQKPNYRQVKSNNLQLRFPTGLTANQALITISHNKEEIPDSVRQYIRLPFSSPSRSSDIDTVDEGSLDFKIGTIPDGEVFNSGLWDVIWTREVDMPAFFRQREIDERMETEKKIEEEKRKKREERRRKLVRLKEGKAIRERMEEDEIEDKNQD